MIFQHTHTNVLNGTKTQTRRLVKPGEYAITIPADRDVPLAGRISAVMDDAKQNGVIYAVGKDYAVQPGRTAKGIARIRITDIRCEDVRNISDEDVKAEGFADHEEFFEVWCTMHDPAILPFYTAMYRRGWLTPQPAYKYQAWVITFELVQP